MGVTIARIEHGGQGSQELGIVQEEFALAVGALVAALGGVGAAVVLQVEIDVPRRQAVSDLSLQLAEEFAHLATLELRRSGKMPHLSDVLHHLPRGAAAPIAPPKRHEERRRHAGLAPVLLLEVSPGLVGLFGGSIGGVGADGDIATPASGAEMG